MARSGPPERQVARTATGNEAEPPVEVAPETLEPVVEILRPLLRDPNQAPQAVARMAAQLFRGPIPPPDYFKGYDDVLPGSAREILDMAKSEQAHRHTMQLLEMVYPYLGWFAGFVGFLACVTAAIYLAMNGHDNVALGALGVPCLGVIGWFIRSRHPSPQVQDAPAPAKDKRTPARRRR